MGAGLRHAALVGRQRELRFLSRQLDDVLGGEGCRLVLLEGEAGIGKSRLLAETTTRARVKGFVVLRGAAEELELDRPFGAIAEALEVRTGRRTLQKRIRNLMNGMAGDSSSGEASPNVSYVVTDLMLDVLEQAASKRPVLLALDDIHWADPSTLIVLHRATRRLARSQILIVGTMRPVPRTAELDLLVTGVANAQRHLAVEGLGQEGVAALIREALRADPDAHMLTQLSGAAGNPFYLLELVSALVEEGAVQVSDGHATTDAPILPLSLRLTILRRLSFLPPSALEALRMAAVLGSSFSIADLAAVTDRPIVEVAFTLKEAVDAGLVIDRGGRLVFRHDLVREAIYDDLGPAFRAGLHLQVARRLAASRAPSTQVAIHFALGASEGDREAIDWLLKAGRESIPLSPGISADLLGRAVELLPISEERDEVTAELVHALLWAGRMREAETVAREALARPLKPAVRGSIRNGLARVLVWQGRPADSLVQIELALSEPGIDDRERSYLLAELALRRLHCRDLSGATTAAEESIALAQHTVHPMAQCDALCALAWVEEDAGDLSAALAYAREAVQLAASDDGREARVMAPSIYEASVLVHADRFAEAEASASRGVQEHIALGVVRTLPLLHAWRALRHYLAGDWVDAASSCDLSLAYADEVGLRAFAIWPSAIEAHMALHRGDLAAASEAVLRGEREFAPNNPSRFGLPWFVWARALIAEAEGRPDQALDLLAGIWEYLTARNCLGETQELAPDLLRLAVASGDLDRAAATARHARMLADRALTASSVSAALLCEGMLEGDPEALLAAVVAARGTPRMVSLAQACELAGVALAEQGRRDEAASLLGEAIEHLQFMGAQRDARRAEAVLRGLGIRRGIRGPRQRPTSGWAALTTTEVEVARLVAQGLSNPEIGELMFITRRTVASHLSHIFGKLGVASRRELAAQVRRLDDDSKSSTLTDVPGVAAAPDSGHGHPDLPRVSQAAVGSGRDRG